MKRRNKRKTLTLLFFLILAFPLVVWAGVMGTTDSDMSDSAGNAITGGDLSAVGEISTVAGALELAPAIKPPSKLTQQDYQKVYEQAQTLLLTGINFRLDNLQLPPACTTPEECLINYQDFNDGELYDAFCADYDQIDEQGYCPGANPSTWPANDRDIRSQLIRARELFAFLSLVEPIDTAVDTGGESVNARELGRRGVLSATREIANIHLIFGNEFLVDALDYRFSGATPQADLILAEEINQLELAQQQFTQAVDILAHAFNADFGGANGTYIGDYFTEREYELFGIVSERMVMAIDEIADRKRQQGKDDEALALYADAFAAQYVQALALAYSAAEQDADFMSNGGWEIINNMEGLRAKAQTIHDGINPFGFVDEYVPLQTYAELYALTQNNFLRDATEDEATAANAQREFDQNATALNNELQNLRLTYDNQLLQLCGQSDDYYQDCEGGLMEQNFHAMIAASRGISLTEKQLEQIPVRVEIEEQRASRVITITLEGGAVLSATEYAKGVLNSYRVTDAFVTATTDDWYIGDERRFSASFNLGYPPSFGISGSKSFFDGYKHSRSETQSITAVWDQNQIALGMLNSIQALQQAAIQADIIGANSEATIRNILLQEAELMIEKDIATAEYNRLAAEHNHLVETYHNWLDLQVKAQDNFLDSYLNNPAYRILRDSLTVEAARSHGLAAQFAYLTAKALEYDFLTPYPSLGDIYKARTADDIDNFLNDLEQWRVALGSPGDRNRYPYRISVAQDILGLSDENLDPDGTLSPSQLAQLRYAEFQIFMQRHMITDTNTGEIVAIEFPFTTSILDNRIFSPNIWNNRIAGVGLPPEVPGTLGISLNLLTRQFGNVGTPEVRLTHGGHASYRTVIDEIVEYTPENAKLSGYTVPAGFESQTKTALILSGGNGNNQGTPSSALFNRSVAASNWTLRIDLTSPFNADLDFTQLEDIEIDMDTTGIALPAFREAAQRDAERLQIEFERK